LGHDFTALTTGNSRYRCHRHVQHVFSVSNMPDKGFA